jgi:hypothetical protein
MNLFNFIVIIIISNYILIFNFILISFYKFLSKIKNILCSKKFHEEIKILLQIVINIIFLYQNDFRIFLIIYSFYQFLILVLYYYFMYVNKIYLSGEPENIVLNEEKIINKKKRHRKNKSQIHEYFTFK